MLSLPTRSTGKSVGTVVSCLLKEPDTSDRMRGDSYLKGSWARGAMLAGDIVDVHLTVIAFDAVNWVLERAPYVLV